MQNFFNIPKEIYDMINKNATTLYDKYHKEYVRYVDQRYEFKSLFGINDTRIIRKVDEPDWNINKELTEAVYKDMPQDLSIEEKALYIYIKLCQELEYNEEYFYRNKGITDQFNSDFSQEYLESIKPRTKITCFDFARILSKFLNELNGDIESVIISFGINRGHFSTGFYTDNISVKLEPININLNGKKDPTNDLMKAKNGIKLKGIQPMFDKDEIVESSLNKVYSLIYGKDALSIKDFLNELKTIPKEEIRDNFKLKLQSFIEIMKERKITGNEFVQTIEGMFKSNFFGLNIEKAFIGKRVRKDAKTHIQRMLLFRKNHYDKNKEPNLYLLDSSTLELTEPTSQEIIYNLNINNMVYESNNYKITGIDKEV